MTASKFKLLKFYIKSISDKNATISLKLYITGVNGSTKVLRDEFKE